MWWAFFAIAILCFFFGEPGAGLVALAIPFFAREQHE